MDEKQLQNLFRDFAPLDADTLKRYGGTGLSLMIAQRHCQLMQGAIRAESELGKGSTFAMHLPANVEAVAGVQSYDRARELVRPYVAASRAGTVLVVDDDPIVCDLVERVLSKEGYRVVVARNGEDALRLAGEILPDMITLDVIMPGMDGWSVLAALRANRRFALTPIIMLTTSSDNKSKGYTLGASEYLNKPLNREELIAALNKYRRKEQG